MEFRPTMLFSLAKSAYIVKVLIFLDHRTDFTDGCFQVLGEKTHYCEGLRVAFQALNVHLKNNNNKAPLFLALPLSDRWLKALIVHLNRVKGRSGVEEKGYLKQRRVFCQPFPNVN